jgi:hypothetical protein
MKAILKKKIWFLTGTQFLYGEDTLKQVSSNAKAVIEGLNLSGHIPLEIVFKHKKKLLRPVLKPHQTMSVLALSHGCTLFLLLKCGLMG